MELHALSFRNAPKRFVFSQSLESLIFLLDVVQICYQKTECIEQDGAKPRCLLGNIKLSCARFKAQHFVLTEADASIYWGP